MRICLVSETWSPDINGVANTLGRLSLELGRRGLPAGRRIRRLWQTSRPDVVYLATQGPLGWSALRCATFTTAARPPWSPRIDRRRP